MLEGGTASHGNILDPCIITVCIIMDNKDNFTVIFRQSSLMVSQQTALKSTVNYLSTHARTAVI